MTTSPRTHGRGRLAAPWRGLLISCLSVAQSAVGCVAVLAILLIPLGVGIPMLPPVARALRALSDRSRGWAAEWSGVTIDPPRPLPTADSRLRHCLAVLGDHGFLRDLRWSILDPVSGGILAWFPPSFVLYGIFGSLVQPFAWKAIDNAGGGNWYAFVPVRSTGTMLAAAALGVVFIVLGFLTGPAWLRIHARWTRMLLATPRNERLERRVERLTDTRAEALDTQAAELRRIERDLHDGAQARLVAMGMTLDNAQRLLDDDPGTARTLLLEVRQNSSRALEELRNLVRGIHPPVLADRGLGDAVRSLALDSVIDVDVDVRLPGRVAPPVESAAYFAVSELLTNAAKHSGARRIAVVLAHANGVLRVDITDDGHGGADPARGTGLLGIQRRLGVFDGTLALHSPPGGPTNVTLEIPCALSLPRTSSSSGTG